ncbi:MAG TPA: nuclear transport factor 2 family protein [Longimicrobiales bacterium]|nr:nuclear transport factor 2 family protein [Longimicrobiales bacterium]
MLTKRLILAAPICLAFAANPLAAQARPDVSGIWRLDVAQSQMVGGGRGVPGPEYQLTWLVDHRDPDISVSVNVRDSHGSHEYSFRCTTDGRECLNELPELQEVRRMVAAWKADTLVMSQRANTPHGDFDAKDQLFLSTTGQLIFARTVINERGARPVRMVFRKLGPHPSRTPAPQALPGVSLPTDLAHVLRDYERHWRAGDSEALAGLFSEDGVVARRGGWVRGSHELRAALEGTSSDLRLRAVAYAIEGSVGYIIGNYGYGEAAAAADRGMFILTLRQSPTGRWLISADLDGVIRP